jgi:Zn finger protein HypA/HybF involved in hydrogenase expression
MKLYRLLYALFVQVVLLDAGTRTDVAPEWVNMDMSSRHTHTSHSSAAVQMRINPSKIVLPCHTCI